MDKPSPLAGLSRPHHIKGRFAPPGDVSNPKLRDGLKWLLSGEKQKWPRHVENAPWPAPPETAPQDGISLTFIGHATLLIQVGGLNILTDPFFSDRASPLPFIGPKRARKPGVALPDLPPIDVVLLSHNHFDHLDIAALRALHAHSAPHIVTPLGNSRTLARTRRPHRITEGNWGDQLDLNDKVRATFTPALHWSKRGLFDRNRALWSGFVLQTPAGVIYFAGDTGYGDGAHFDQLRQVFGPPKLSLLPIGAYAPRWFMQDQHMDPQQAVQAHRALGAQHSVAIHFGTIQLTDEGIDAPAQELAEALAEAPDTQGEFLVLECGETRGF